MPIVSVVVVGYNDAAHLAKAVRSATAQTVRDIEVIVVDDGSTDATPEVTARLAAADPRVRAVRLEVNSGSGGRPRNAGLEHASGRYVTFLDSDDVLPRRSCERLLAAAVRADADLACGRYVRRHLHPRRFIAAFDDLYARPAVLGSILDRPELLRDTVSCSKLYRRAFLEENGLRFPEGLVYEDLFFITQAYCTARRIAIVPNLVYVWNVRRDSATPSVTNRRDVRNWRDRFEIHRRIDAFLAAHDATPALRAAKDRKFLDVDFSWFLRQLRQFPTDQRAALLDLAADYLRTLDLAGPAAGDVTSRVGAFLAAHGDLERTLTAADWAATGQVGSDLAVDGGRVHWTHAYLDSAAGREALDVTGTGLLDADFARTPFLTVAVEASVDADRLVLTGHVHDVLGRLGDPASLEGTLVVTGRVGGEMARSPVRLSPAAPGAEWHADWTTDIDLGVIGRRMLRPTVGHELRLWLVLARGEAQARMAVTARDAVLPADPIRIPTPWRQVLGERARLVEANGRLVLALTDLPGYVEHVFDAASLVRYVGRRSWRRVRLVGS